MYVCVVRQHRDSAPDCVVTAFWVCLQ